MKIPTLVREALERTGLPWAAENGGRHIKIRLNGRLVGVCPKGPHHDVGHSTKNIVAQIRRAAEARP